ncbi:hypothetical protein K469DRAFT_775925 [Zopfia rhizophila CBS 207.26]|uniref:Uncharacterized protein n=1 Tax=Zopfia rhizophila CBS 207.26 TaxID=1314779 RepID=A0A6A6D639_9PEZI|nr:hypothetical protein K469DRAFT_775925 [Zopfia rhizophila CBS 207.26]
MVHTILIGYIVCSSCGLVLTVMLIYRDIKPRRTNERDRTYREYSHWKRALPALFDLAQATLFVTVITAVTISITSSSRFNWIDLAITCTLQLIVGTNLARHLRALTTPSVVTYLPYTAIIVLTARDVVFYLENPLTRDSSGLLIWNRKTKILFIYESVVLFSLAIGPLISAAISYQQLRQHENLGGNNRKYKGLLTFFIVTNVIAALCKLCGATVLLCFFLPDRAKPNIRHGVFLACISAQLLCALIFCFRSIPRWIIKWIRAHTDGNDLGEAVELDSRVS